ncbi:putative secreted protein [Corynebacterium kutscheri]|uniref:Secreted protein n=1 Tax=Corynebacterium kutscheri TaxID=35755 RepID=A0A0F6TDG9_9CORY|nr:VWA domain-containing protein [Corynebacterium kutscheri]AKE41176.1 von Willebrand factor type A domain [Corynebacterium kutscheri]VEH08452.1 putative secreted protein [Corynebacterium kutscheri]VEH09498.1 putative secreted protein [Corynebacterium kutscheri]VEH79581.1 putative secreted protein [Corynebacterium kutscheri]
MGRHTTGEKNNKIAGSLIATIIAIIVAIALAVFWFVSTRTNDSTMTSANCVAGDLSLGVAADTEERAQSFIEAYNASSPIVRDHCVTARYSELSEAGVYLTTSSEGQVNALLTEANRSAATLDWPTIAQIPAGVISTGAFDWNNPDAITYAVATNSVAAALVSAQVNNNSVDTIHDDLNTNRTTTLDGAVADQAQTISATENDKAEGYSFFAAPDLYVPVRAVALSPTDSVSEDTTRAGADFSSSQTVAETTNTTARIAAYEALALFDGSATADSNASAPGSNQEQPVTDTLYLFDTSASMGTVFETTAQAIADAALAIGAQNHPVALWNYSSPLNPGVTQGWRVNVAFSNGAGGNEAATAVTRFGTGGMSYTRSSLHAALSSASAQAQETSRPVRVVLVTTGTDDTDDLSTSTQTAQAAGVILDVVHIGTGEQDTAVATAAQELKGNVYLASEPNQIADAIASASGLGS